MRSRFGTWDHSIGNFIEALTSFQSWREPLRSSAVLSVLGSLALEA